MNPDETLERLRDMVVDGDYDAGDYERAVRDLDEWLSKGGALPTAWARPDSAKPELSAPLYPARNYLMDPNGTNPNEALAALRRVLESVEAEVCTLNTFSTVERKAERAVDLFQALDEWLSKGGTPPTQWAGPERWAKDRPEQLFEVRVHCEGASVVVGRYYDYAKALSHVTLLKSRVREMALIGASGADVVPVEVMP